MKAFLEKADTPNKNGRIYPKQLLEKIANQKGVYGYFIDRNHEPEIQTISDISHKIDRLFIENDSLYAEISVLNTPNGNLLKEHLENTVFVLNGFGKIDSNQKLDCDSYKLVSVNAVKEK